MPRVSKEVQQAIDRALDERPSADERRAESERSRASGRQ